MTRFPAIPERFPASSMDQVNYLDRTSNDKQGRSVITFSGRVDANRMVRAVRLTLDAEPVLGCRFFEHPWRPYWKRRDDLDDIPLCRLTESQDSESELWKFIGAPMNPLAGPQVQVCIFRSERDVLCIKLSHLVADAGGTREYLRLLATTYRTLGLNHDYRPVPNLHGSRRPIQVLTSVEPRQLRSAGIYKTLLQASRRFVDSQAAWGFPTMSRDFSGRAFSLRRIGAGRLAKIKAYGDLRKASVNDVLLTAFYRSLFKTLDPPVDVSLPVTVPVDLRRYLPSGRAGAICNLTGGFFPSITRKPGATFEETLNRVHSVMHAAKGDHAELAQVLFLELASLPGFAAFKCMFARQVSGPFGHPFFSNLGIIDPAEADFGENRVVELSMFGPVPYPPNFIFTACTFRSTLILTIGFCDTATDRGLIEQFLDSFVSELPE